ncbi:hypothetical protein [Novosphingobium sp.]|uniref:hypothetical protein n=1 Tax=Novosphingobium sp. TaxID=1874826 RepID=UPI001ECC0DF0|nr:hypothetical protein [Novosphingobium sp.]MBK6800793.1 hypothetical protein [Novosphingobium sp.]MBK9011351.1 hypothetical protein [Novosphingobium sp.]
MNRVAAQFRARMRALASDRAGLSTTELGILLAMVVLASIPALSLLGDETAQTLDQSSSELARDRAVRADPFARGAGAGAAADVPVSGTSVQGTSNTGSPEVTPIGSSSSSGGYKEPPVAAASLPEPYAE